MTCTTIFSFGLNLSFVSFAQISSTESGVKYLAVVGAVRCMLHAACCALPVERAVTDGGTHRNSETACMKSTLACIRARLMPIHALHDRAQHCTTHAAVRCGANTPSGPRLA